MIGPLFRLLFSNAIGNVLLGLRNLMRAPRALFSRVTWVRIEIEEPLPARPPRHRRWFGKRARSIGWLADTLDELSRDRRLEGVVLRIHSLPRGWGRLQTLRDQITRFRKSGKRVVAHLSGPSTREYFVACACDSIVVDEAAPLHMIGLAAEALFFADALGKLGVIAETEYRGPYKSFAETFTRTDMSDAHREALDAILDQIESELRRAMTEGRGVEPERAAELLTGGPYQPAAAAELGLIDAVRYYDELPDWLGHPAPKLRTVKAWRRGRFLRFRWKPLRRRRRIRVLPLHGAIVTGEGGVLGRQSLGSRAAQRALDAARKDPHTAAVVLHVDSRGGSAHASDLIWRAVVRLGRKKPVVAYFDDVAASGGYYLACAASAIVAQPLTLTGSIGVVSGKLNLAGLYERLGINSVILTRGPAATLDHSSRGYSSEERRRLAAEVDALYQQFVAKVAEGRAMEVERAEEVARGRVWTGSAAHERGLVDVLGGVDVAIERAKKLAARRPGERFTVQDAHVVPKRRGLLARAMAEATLPLPAGLGALIEAESMAREGALLIPGFTLRWL